MTEQILRFLREADNGFVSGQMLCDYFGVSRQAVWKKVSSLKTMGYDIEAVPKKGYRLVGEPDILFGPDIESRLQADGFCRKVLCQEEVDSTNDLAKRLAESGEAEGTLVVADNQTAGRGRRGRGWASEHGAGLWMSLILRPVVEPARISGITLLSALAMAEAIGETYGVSPQIKWPNDIILNGKKICGILTEMSSELNYIHYAVVGLGVNVNTRCFPKEISVTATSVYLETGTGGKRAALAEAFVVRFGKYYKKFLEAGSLEPFLRAYDGFLANRDRQVVIYHGMVEDCPAEQMEIATARGIDRDGALLVDGENGRKRVISGEVSIRGIGGYV